MAVRTKPHLVVAEPVAAEAMLSTDTHTTLTQKRDDRSRVKRDEIEKRGNDFTKKGENKKKKDNYGRVDMKKEKIGHYVCSTTRSDSLQATAPMSEFPTIIRD